MPLTGTALLDAVRDAISRIESVGMTSIVDSSVSASPESWTNRSVSWEVVVGDLAAQLVIWEDGNVELDLVNMAAIEAKTENRHVDEQSDLDDLLSEVCDWVTGTSPDGKR